jgi:hypothetical protein
MKHLFILIVLLSATVSISAQTVKAITQYGETVVLFENGTWKYEKDLQTNASTANAMVPAAVASAITTSSITIDNTKEVTSEKTELFNAVSKKLARFFGEEKGKIRCSVSATNNKGEVMINFEFMIPLGDANRYFGYTAADRPLQFTLTDGTVLKNTFTQNIEEKFIEKWNVSYYKASIVLSDEEVNQLIKSNAIRLQVNWKKTDEEYNIDQTEAIRNILSEVI